MFSFDYKLPDLKKLDAVRLKPLHVKDQLEIMIVESYNNVTKNSILKRIHERGVLLGAQLGKAHEQMLARAKEEMKYAESTLGTLLEFHADEMEREAAIPKEPIEEKPPESSIES